MDPVLGASWGLISLRWLVSTLQSRTKTFEHKATKSTVHVTDIYLHTNDLNKFFFNVTKLRIKHSITKDVIIKWWENYSYCCECLFNHPPLLYCSIVDNCFLLPPPTSPQSILLWPGFTSFTYWNISLHYDNLLHTPPHPCISHNVHKNSGERVRIYTGCDKSWALWGFYINGAKTQLHMGSGTW
jgi:hypothetical protein